MVVPIITNTTIDIIMEMNSTTIKTTAFGVHPVLMAILIIAHMTITGIVTTMMVVPNLTTGNPLLMKTTLLHHTTEEELYNMKKILGTLRHHQEGKKIHHIIQILMIDDGFSLNNRLMLISGTIHLLMSSGFIYNNFLDFFAITSTICMIFFLANYIPLFFDHCKFFITN